MKRRRRIPVEWHEGAMRCEQIMSTNVECSTTRETVEHAAIRMRSRSVGFLCVLDDEQRIVGTLTDRDLAMRVVADALPAAHTKVGAVMSPGLVWCRASDPLELAVERMIEASKSRIVCVDDDGAPVGVISVIDLARLASSERAGDVLRAQAEASRQHEL